MAAGLGVAGGFTTGFGVVFTVVFVVFGVVLTGAFVFVVFDFDVVLVVFVVFVFGAGDAANTAAPRATVKIEVCKAIFCMIIPLR